MGSPAVLHVPTLAGLAYQVNAGEGLALLLHVDALVLLVLFRAMMLKLSTVATLTGAADRPGA